MTRSVWLNGSEIKHLKFRKADKTHTDRQYKSSQTCTSVELEAFEFSVPEKAEDDNEGFGNGGGKSECAEGVKGNAPAPLPPSGVCKAVEAGGTEK